MEPHNEAFERLVKLMDELRVACPWDKKQTIHTLRQQTIEECYELVDAISDDDWKGIKEELGDLLLHIIFYSKIGSEQLQFSLAEMINGICDKLIARHPHVYGNVNVENDEEVKRNWEMLKLKEGKTSVLSGVPKALPALIKAMRLQHKAKQVGFDWDTKERVWEKVEEEIAELEEAISLNDSKKIEEEYGDVLFSLVNYARFLNVDAEAALEQTNKKFTRRFLEMEKLALKDGRLLNELSLNEMETLWIEIKQNT